MSLIQFINGGALDSVKELVSVNIRPLLLMLGDYRSLNMSVLQVCRLVLYIHVRDCAPRMSLYMWNPPKW